MNSLASLIVLMAMMGATRSKPGHHFGDLDYEMRPQLNRNIIYFPNEDNNSNSSGEYYDDYPVHGPADKDQYDYRPKRPKYLQQTTHTNNIDRPMRKPSSPTRSSKRRVCEIKYSEYIRIIFPEEADTLADANDSDFNGRSLAAPGEFPHMAALGFRTETGEVDYKCGGSLISDRFVITAAHCTNITGEAPSQVRIGDLNLMVEESYLEPQIRGIRNIFTHPEYKANSYYNDIALLELSRAVEFTEFVRPIRLWTRPTMPFTVAYAMGYGSTAFGRRRTNRLTHLNMTIVPNDECNREMPEMPETELGVISSQICARDYAMNRDTCQGDSGGPLQLNLRGSRGHRRVHYHLIGITSYGLFCRSGYPSIFTRVYSYLDWIEHIVWRESFL